MNYIEKIQNSKSEQFRNKAIKMESWKSVTKEVNSANSVWYDCVMIYFLNFNKTFTLYVNNILQLKNMGIMKNP